MQGSSEGHALSPNTREPSREPTIEAPTPEPPRKARVAANRFGLDYRREAARLPTPPVPIVDFHAHVNGPGAIPIWAEAARLYGVNRVFTMVRLGDAEVVREKLGDMVRFIAFPDFRKTDRLAAFTHDFLDDIHAFHSRFGARIVKLWNAPRIREFFPGDSGKDIIEFDAPWRVKAAELAQSLGMMMMVHVADPDTWFATKYADPRVYGTKLSYYRGLEVMLDRFPMPWIAAHMGGWPENLAFLDGLLERHPNLYIDTSATKWVVRELSRHPRERVFEFFTRWRGRLLFGSDIVTTDEHLAPKAGPPAHPMADLANSPESAFDLYASRYFALRTMFETDYEGESPIADPDLKMVAPDQYDDMAAPPLRGLRFPPDLLSELYRGAAEKLMARVGVTV
ncbi:MAG TPA: hypothetical protein VD997_10530 [Phycisphaerales bacterium]|nr:hypothetical protein [Phycisphaerales bacterium]